MRRGARIWLALGILTVLSWLPARVWADETDNFTCRGRPLTDSAGALDGWVNARILEAVDRANRRGSAGCDAACLTRELQDRIGGSARRPPTWIPHARLARWIERQPGIDRCHLAFEQSIYGARPYNQPWRVPFTHRIIFLADSIRLADRVVGIDKINHFIREGLAHWRAAARPGHDIAAVVAQELGPPGRSLRMTEHGLKGMTLTGVLSYADLAASYAGFGFWGEALSLGQPGSLVAYDPASRRFVQRRPFSVAEYVNDAWDESINCSAFHPALGKEVRAALDRRATTCPVTDCRHLAGLKNARLYVSPVCQAPPRDYGKLSMATGARVPAGVKPNTLP